MKLNLRAVMYHMGWQCYLPPNTNEHTLPLP